MLSMLCNSSGVKLSVYNILGYSGIQYRMIIFIENLEHIKTKSYIDFYF